MSGGVIVILIADGLIFGFAAGTIRANQGGTFAGGFWWGFLLGIIGLIVVVATKPTAAAAAAPAAPGPAHSPPAPTTPRPVGAPASNPKAVRECPHCKEAMRRDASVCPHCRRDSDAWRYWVVAGRNSAARLVRRAGRAMARPRGHPGSGSRCLRSCRRRPRGRSKLRRQGGAHRRRGYRRTLRGDPREARRPAREGAHWRRLCHRRGCPRRDQPKRRRPGGAPSARNHRPEPAAAHRIDGAPGGGHADGAAVHASPTSSAIRRLAAAMRDRTVPTETSWMDATSS
jgi:RNA polymerase subunit RPABC4/transcription elongation factor Spt4